MLIARGVPHLLAAGLFLAGFFLVGGQQPARASGVAMTGCLGARGEAENRKVAQLAEETRNAKKDTERGSYAFALRRYQNVLSELARIHGPQHGCIAVYKNEIGIVYMNMGRYDRAREAFAQAADIAGKLGDSKDVDVAAIYNNLGAALGGQGAYEKALSWHWKALAIREKAGDADTAQTCNDIASLYDRQGKYGKALEWYARTLAIREKVLGARHPETLMTYDGIATVHEHMGEYDQARELRNKALAVREKNFGWTNP